MNSIARLQSYFQSCCDGDWEHSFGISIKTLDNPGWIVKIRVDETSRQDSRFDPVSVDRSEEDWINIRLVDGNILQGAGGVNNLNELLDAMLDWLQQW